MDKITQITVDDVTYAINDHRIEEVSDVTGTSTKKVMSQGAVTKVINRVNLLDMKRTLAGYIAADGVLAAGSYITRERTSAYIDIVAGAKYQVRVVAKRNNDLPHWCGVAFYDVDKKFITRTVDWVDGGDTGDYSIAYSNVTSPDNAVYARVSARTFGNGFFEFRRSDEKCDFPYMNALGEQYEKAEQMAFSSFASLLPAIYNHVRYTPFPSIDTSADTLTIPFDTLIIDPRLDGGYYSIKGAGDYGNHTVISLSGVVSSARCVYFDISSKTFHVEAFNTIVDFNNNLLICCYRKGTAAFASCPVLVDGQLHHVYNNDTSEIKLTNKNIKSVNHRGYNVSAPENTLSAFKLSKENGFDYVECDVSFTSDNVAVLLHDDTVDRTSNGSGSIYALTFAEVRALDFGSWFSAKYAGEKIPSFEEFMLLCRNIGLHPYIELKFAITETQATNLVNIVKRCGMRGKVTWISFTSASLARISECDSSARLGYVVHTITDDTIQLANGLKNDSNEVFIDAEYSSITEDAINKCMNADLPLEVWTVNNRSAVVTLDRYITGVTSDSLIAGNILVDETRRDFT